MEPDCLRLDNLRSLWNCLKLICPVVECDMHGCHMYDKTLHSTVHDESCPN